jgi:hypothetical protein
MGYIHEQKDKAGISIWLRSERDLLMRMSLAMVCLASCCAANAAPAYFECAIPEREYSAAASYKITVDEEAGTAVFSESTQGSESQTLPARFTPTDIRFIAVMPIVKLSVEYRIDRTSLQFTRMVRVGSLRVQYGTCKLAEADETVAEARRDQAAGHD